MKKTIVITLFFVVTSICALGYAENQPQVASDTSTAAAPESSGPAVKKMQGRISGINTTQKSFKITPDNVGEPIPVKCESGAEACKVDGLLEGIDGEAALYNQDGQWLAKSITQKS